jgi:endonuclease/exonuclease/phosphatase family metal-dependent hydrolase
MTFNIRFANPDDGPNAWPNRRGMVAEILRAQAADFVGLQEALHTQLADLEPMPSYARIGVGRDDGRDAGEFSPIYYRSDRFALESSATFWLSPTPERPGSTGWGNHVPRICTWGRFLDRKTGRRLYVFNTHMDHESQPARAHGAELIAARIAARGTDDPVLMMGDFNSGEDNPVIGYLTGRLERANDDASAAPPSPRLADTFRLVHPDATLVGTTNDWTGVTTTPKIDYILAPPPPAAEVLESTIVHDARDGRYPSDHYPLVARLRLRGGRTRQ